MEANATNFNAVKELILDEHKTVTYISISKELCIHVNEAKSLLCQMVKDLRKAQPETNLSVSYMISGLLNNGAGCTTVCSENDRDALKKTLKNIFYEHVYSVSRGVKCLDNVALSAINKFEDLSLCTGLIKANSCIKRTDNEIGNLKSKNQAILNVPNVNILQKPKDKVKQIIDHEDIKTVNKVKLESNVKSEVTSPKKVEANNKTPTRTNNTKTAGKGIAGFFSKVNGDSIKTKKAKVQEPETIVKKDIKVEPKGVDNNNLSKHIINDAPEKDLKEKSISKDSLKQIKKTAKVDKKRKRLLHVSDSESETDDKDPFSHDMDVDHESEDEIPPTPTISTVKITSGIVNPKKRRKIVDKTYTDEDGYILTKKEEVYESCSDNEEDKDVKTVKENADTEKENVKIKSQNTEQVKQFKTETSPKENKSKKKKVSPPQKGKQSTINSFFKKL